MPSAHVLRLALACMPLLVAVSFVLLAAWEERARLAGVTPPPHPGDGLVFMVVGDWGRDGHAGQRKVARAMAKVARRVGPRFIVSSGDNFYEEGVDSVDDPHWASSFENVYSDPALREVGWWVTLGNHDHLQSIAAQIHYSGRSRRWTLPAPYYSFDTMRDGDSTRLDVQFVFLDSTPFTHDGYGKAARKIGKQHFPDQVAWLEQTLANSTAQYFIIVVHHNMYTMSTTGHLGTSELRAHVEPLLLRHGPRVLAVITGHEHSLMHMQPYGGPGAWAGAAAAPSEGHTRAGGSGHPGRGRTARMATVDHFISGGGSAIDDITPPAADKARVWAACCGVLRTDAAHDEPRALWGSATRGFFVFTITSNMFYATAYDDKAHDIYSYRKELA
jgi:tartrate-resistant acid phosphatase type 5